MDVPSCSGSDRKPFPPGMGAGKLDHGSTGADSHNGRHLEDSQADRRRLPVAGFKILPDPGPKFDEEQIGKGAQPQAHLIGPHLVAACPDGEQLQLVLLDAVFHVAPGTIKIFVEGAGWPLVLSQIGDDEPGVGLAYQCLGLGHDPAFARPGFTGLPGQFLEDPLGLA